MASTEFATGSHKGERFLFLLGLALVAVGAGFALAPHYSWQVTKVAHAASAMGLHSGALLVGGLVLIGLGIVSRSVSSGHPASDNRAEYEALQSDLNLFNEQLTTKLAQMRAAIMQVQDAVTSVSTQQQALIQEQPAHGAPGDNAQDAIFRLAASLDKLHAHFDERVHAVDLQLRSGFEALLNASHDVRRHLGQGPSAPTLELSPSHPHQAHGQAHGHGPSHGHTHGQAHAQPGGIDFYETMQKLDAIAGAADPQASPSPSRGRHPQPPLPSQSTEQQLDALLPEEYRDRY
jgi:hypothetical protein